MRKSTQQAVPRHSVLGYMQRLPNKELFRLLRCCLNDDGDLPFKAEEIIAVLESRFEESEK